MNIGRLHLEQVDVRLTMNQRKQCQTLDFVKFPSRPSLGPSSSETGLVYTFTTTKLQPLVTSTNASSPPRSSDSHDRPSAPPNHLPDPPTPLAGLTIASPILHVPSRSHRASESPPSTSQSPRDCPGLPRLPIPLVIARASSSSLPVPS